MMRMATYARVAAPVVLAISALVFVGHRAIEAADHLDPPARTDPAVDPTPDRAADIADIYAFHDANNLVIALTFAGPAPANAPGTYDPDVLYKINISNAGSRADTEIPIEIRFGLDGANNAGVEVRGLPGTRAIQGPVETNLSQDGYLVRAGLFDDPFFFDLQGFRDTQSSGNLMFNNQRSFFSGQNDTAVVLQIPRSRIENGSNPLDIWAETGRIGGQL